MLMIVCVLIVENYFFLRKMTFKFKILKKISITLPKLLHEINFVPLHQNVYITNEPACHTTIFSWFARKRGKTFVFIKTFSHFSHNFFSQKNLHKIHSVLIAHRVMHFLHLHIPRRFILLTPHDFFFVCVFFYLKELYKSRYIYIYIYIYRDV